MNILVIPRDKSEKKKLHIFVCLKRIRKTHINTINHKFFDQNSIEFDFLKTNECYMCDLPLTVQEL